MNTQADPRPICRRYRDGYQVFVGGQFIGCVWRDSSVTAGYSGAWRGNGGADGDTRSRAVARLITVANARQAQGLPPFIAPSQDDSEDE